MSGVWPLTTSIVVFAVAASITVFGGVRLARLGDILAARTGWGEALFGAIFFGSMISLSGVVMTATAGLGGHPTLAYSNAVGGIAAQTTALVVADMFHRRANIEHAAASISNVLFGTLLISMLSVALAAPYVPEFAVLGVHPGSFVLVGAYGVGLRMIRKSEEEPLWSAEKTRLTVEEEAEEEGKESSTASLWMRFLAFGAIVAAGGWAIARSAEGIVSHTPLQESLVGGVLMGATNAIPETITSIAAVRRGALTLAIGGVLGGNTFDALNVAVGDVAFRDGSLYHAASNDDLFLTAATVLMTTALIAGLLRRERHGPANIGLEGWLVLGIYLTVVVVLAI